MRCRGFICCDGVRGSESLLECLPCVGSGGVSLLRSVYCGVRLFRAGAERVPTSAVGAGSCFGAGAYLVAFGGLSPWDVAVWVGRPSLAGFFRDVAVFVNVLGVDGAEAVVAVGERLRFGVGHLRASKAVRDAIALIDLFKDILPDRGGWAPLTLAGAALMEIGLPYGVSGHEVRSAALAKSAPEIVAGIGHENAEGLYYAIKYHVPGPGDPRDDPEAPESIVWDAAVASAILKVVSVTSNYPDPVEAVIDPPYLLLGVGPESSPHLLKAAKHLARLAGLSPATLRRS